MKRTSSGPGARNRTTPSWPAWPSSRNGWSRRASSGRRCGCFPTTSATTLRKSQGEPLVIDGPFAETKEQLLGFFIIDVANLDEALDIARELAAANTGSTYEIRPIALYLGDQRQSSAA